MNALKIKLQATGRQPNRRKGQGEDRTTGGTQEILLGKWQRARGVNADMLIWLGQHHLTLVHPQPARLVPHGPAQCHPLSRGCKIPYMVGRSRHATIVLHTWRCYVGSRPVNVHCCHAKRLSGLTHTQHLNPASSTSALHPPPLSPAVLLRTAAVKFELKSSISTCHHCRPERHPTLPGAQKNDPNCFPVRRRIPHCYRHWNLHHASTLGSAATLVLQPACAASVNDPRTRA